MKKQIVFGLFLVAGVIAVFAFKQDHTPKKYLTLTYNMDRFLSIVNEEGNPLKNIAMENTGINNGEKWIKNGQILLTKELNELSQKGYKLHSSSFCAPSYIIYVFEKE